MRCVSALLFGMADALLATSTRNRDDIHATNPIIFNFFRPNQTELESCQRGYSRMRDFYSTIRHAPCPSAAAYAFATILSESQNGTLVTNAWATHLGLDLKTHTNLYPLVNSIKGSPNLLYDLWIEYRQSIGTVRVMQQEKLDLNFAYCDHPNIELEHPWNLNTYSSLSKYPRLWVLLIISTIIISVILKLQLNTSKHRYSFVDSFLLAYSGIMGAPCIQHGRNSFILIVWMLSCQHIALMYIGTITSRVIAPAEESTLSTISELVAENFKLVFDFAETKNFVNSTAAGYFSYHHKHRRHDATHPTAVDIAALQKLFARDIKVTGDSDDCISELVSGKKFTSIASWPFVVYKVSRANEKLREIGQLGHYHCHLGKRLVPSPNLYYLVFCPSRQNCALDRIIQRVFERGIFHYWNTEHIKMKYSGRVQDRKKVLSPSRIKYSFENDDAVPITIEGRISKIFSIWLVGMLISIFISLFEIKSMFHNT